MIDALERVIRPIVEGQIRGFVKEHPEILVGVTWYKPRQDRAQTLVNSLAKRIVRDLTCGISAARLRAALAGTFPGGAGGDGLQSVSGPEAAGVDSGDCVGRSPCPPVVALLREAADALETQAREIAGLTQELVESDTAAQQADDDATGEIERLRAAILAYLRGDYPRAEDNRQCQHGLYSWNACEQCIDGYFERVLAAEGRST